MTKQIIPDPCGKSLTHSLDVEQLNPLQCQTQQHRHEQQRHDQADGGPGRQTLQPGQAGFVAQHADGLAHQQGLNRSCHRQRHEQHQGQQQTAAVMNEITAQPTHPFPVTDDAHPAAPAAAEAVRTASTMAFKDPSSSRIDRG